MALITLSKADYFHNLEIITSRLKSKNCLTLVLKDNAYGHGILECAEMAKEYGVESVMVKNLREADLIADHFKRILILFDFPKEKTPQNYHTAINMLEAIEQIPSGCNVELKTDSGMHRNGVRESELEEAFARIKAQGLNIKGVFTHHRAGDDLSSELYWQKRNFESIKSKCENLASKHGFGDIKYHSSSSSAFFRQKEIEDDFVRIGIASYGYMDWDGIFGDVCLKPVMQLYGDAVAKRVVKKGERIGYSGISEIEEDTTITTYDIGYGDGFFRIKEGMEYALPNGEKLLPRVSMDSFSAISSADRVLVFDDVRGLAKRFGTITYDVLVKFSPFIRRVVVE